MNRNFIKSKFFWLNLIAVLVMVIQYLVQNNMTPAWIGIEGLAIVILNAIAGIIQSNTTAKVKAENVALKAQLRSGDNIK